MSQALKLSPPVQPGKPQRVLIVDDEPRLCDVIGFYLEDAGYEVLFAHSGREAQQVIQTEQVEAIITDLRMPNGSGVELLDWVKAKTPQKAVVLLMTAQSDISVEEAYHKGAEALLSKPVKADALLQALQGALKATQTTHKPRERFPLVLEVDLLIAGEATATRARTFNIGRGGVFIGLAPDRLPEIGTELQFRLSFGEPKPATIDGQGIVRWSRVEATASGLPTGVGIEFRGLSADSQKAVGEFIDALKERPFIPMG